ncbi:MAG: hypothetical protein ACE15D_18695 [Candidatus Eisenbacteria bacterium]
MKRDEIRQKIFARKATETQTVEAFDTSIVLHKSSFADIENARKGSIDEGTFRADWYNLALLVQSARDEDGELIFERLDRDELLALDGVELDRLVTSLLRLNGMMAGDREARKNDSGRTDSDEPSSASAGS